MTREKQSLTRRQEIAGLLRTGPATADDLAARTGVHPRTVLDDLEHVRRSLAAGEKWVAHGAECGRCGFLFRERARLNTPSRCPKCRSEEIDPPRFEIRAG